MPNAKKRSVTKPGVIRLVSHFKIVLLRVALLIFITLSVAMLSVVMLSPVLKNVNLSCLAEGCIYKSYAEHYYAGRH